MIWPSKWSMPLGLFLFFSLALVIKRADGQKVKNDYLEPGVSAAEVLRGCGFLAKEFYFYTKDGYKINIVRGRNPLINRGKSAQAGTLPILFVHGTVDAAPTLLSSGTRSRPRDFRKHLKWLAKKSGIKPVQLIGLLVNDPSTKNLPFLALNFGYEVWLVNRRGFNKSKGRRGHENRSLIEAIASIPASFLGSGFHPMAGLKMGNPHYSADDEMWANATHLDDRSLDSGWSFWREFLMEGLTLRKIPGALMNFGKFRQQFIQTFDPEYWDFSLDEQAYYDIPEAIEFIVEHSKCKRVHTVGLSSGGALILMAAAVKPKVQAKMASAILWAPSVNMGSARDIVHVMSHLVPLAQGYIGPIPFVFMQQQLAGLLQSLCGTDFMQRNVCARLIDLSFGYSGHEAPAKLSLLANLFEPTSYHEMAQLGQFSRSHRPCKFKFNDPKKNIRRYGQLEPPCYDFGAVKLKHISIYGGNQDLLVSAGDLNITRSQIKVPIKLTIVGGRGVNFNHGGSLSHERADELVLVPSLMDIWRAENSPDLAQAAGECHYKGRRKRTMQKKVVGAIKQKYANNSVY